MGSLEAGCQNHIGLIANLCLADLNIAHGIIVESCNQCKYVNNHHISKFKRKMHRNKDKNNVKRNQDQSVNNQLSITNINVVAVKTMVPFLKLTEDEHNHIKESERIGNF
jgi:hypothetical protein